MFLDDADGRLLSAGHDELAQGATRQGRGLLQPSLLRGRDQALARRPDDAALGRQRAQRRQGMVPQTARLPRHEAAHDGIDKARRRAPAGRAQGRVPSRPRSRDHTLSFNSERDIAASPPRWRSSRRSRTPRPSMRRGARLRQARIDLRGLRRRGLRLVHEHLTRSGRWSTTSGRRTGLCCCG